MRPAELRDGMIIRPAELRDVMIMRPRELKNGTIVSLVIFKRWRDK
jgi:hypothetical protein